MPTLVASILHAHRYRNDESRAAKYAVKAASSEYSHFPKTNILQQQTKLCSASSINAQKTLVNSNNEVMPYRNLWHSKTLDGSWIVIHMLCCLTSEVAKRENASQPSPQSTSSLRHGVKPFLPSLHHGLLLPHPPRQENPQFADWKTKGLPHNLVWVGYLLRSLLACFIRLCLGLAILRSNASLSVWM